jgi:hypothetical protein
VAHAASSIMSAPASHEVLTHDLNIASLPLHATKKSHAGHPHGRVQTFMASVITGTDSK